MTNEEAYKIVSEFCFTGFEDNKKPSGRLFNAIHELVCEVEENTKLKADNEELKEDISQLNNECAGLDNENKLFKAEIERLKIERDSAVIGHRNCSSELNMRMKEIEQLKSDLEQSLDRIKQRIINRRWKVTSDASNLEAIYMSWANTMNDWCVEIVEEAEKSLEGTNHEN